MPGDVGVEVHGFTVCREPPPRPGSATAPYAGGVSSAAYDGGAGYRAYVGDEVVTGEGVSVELPVAGVAIRMASGAIDMIVSIVVLVAAVFVAGMLVADTSDAVVGTMGLIVMVGVFIGLPSLVETLTRGRTVGKLALGLRTVRDDGGPITFRHALTRSLIGFVEIWLLAGVPALITAMLNGRGKRLGDMAAGTYVVSQRAKLRVVPPPSMPWHLASWAGAADIAALPAGLAVAIRQFLSRASSLNPVSRDQIGHELLTEALRYVSPAPPRGSHPEYVLAAIIADRRRRDLERLSREDRLRARLLH